MKKQYYIELLNGGVFYNAFCDVKTFRLIQKLSHIKILIVKKANIKRDVWEDVKI